MHFIFHGTGNRGSGPGNMVPSPLAMNSINSGQQQGHSYVNGGLATAETAMTSFTSGPPSTPASPGFDGEDWMWGMKTDKETDSPTSPYRDSPVSSNASYVESISEHYLYNV